MQELYADLEKIKEISNTILITDIQRMIGNYYNDIEKLQINKAYEEGHQDCHNRFIEINYYEETYKK